MPRTHWGLKRILITSQGSWLSPINSNWLEARQAIQARLYWDPCHWDPCYSFPRSSDGKESGRNAGDSGLMPGSVRSTGEGIGYPLQYSWASLAAQLVKNPPAMRETWFRSLGWKIPWWRGLYPLQYSGLENSVDCIVHGVTRSRKWLSDFHHHFLLQQERAKWSNRSPGPSWRWAKLFSYMGWEEGRVQGQGWRAGLSVLPTPLVVLRAGGMNSTLFLLLALQK